MKQLALELRFNTIATNIKAAYYTGGLTEAHRVTQEYVDNQEYITDDPNYVKDLSNYYRKLTGRIFVNEMESLWQTQPF